MGNQGQDKEYNIKLFGRMDNQKKSYLIKRIKEGKLKGVNFMSEDSFYKLCLKKKNKTIVFNLIDMDTYSESDKYKADCVILEFDINDNESFEELKLEWYSKIKNSNKTDLIYLIGIKNDVNKNKEDIKNKIETFSKTYKMKSLTLSDKENNLDDIKNIFDELLYLFEYKNSTNNKAKTTQIDQKKKEFKVAFVGESGVGSKTSLIHELLHPGNNMKDDMTFYYRNTSIYQKIVELKNGEKITLNLFDTVGLESKRSLTKLILKDSDCIVVGYSITDKHSFEEAKKYWYPTAIEYTDLIYLIGHKSDLFDMEEVKESDAIDFANHNNLRYFLTSCLDYHGIQKFLDDLDSVITKK